MVRAYAELISRYFPPLPIAVHTLYDIFCFLGIPKDPIRKIGKSLHQCEGGTRRWALVKNTLMGQISGPDSACTAYKAGLFDKTYWKEGTILAVLSHKACSTLKTHSYLYTRRSRSQLLRTPYTILGQTLCAPQIVLRTLAKTITLIYNAAPLARILILLPLHALPSHSSCFGNVDNPNEKD